MSYAIYKTEAIIMRVIPASEASLDVVFLTRDLGKITARVQSGRKSESKMRMHLTRYHHVIIDTVRGKNFWRLTGITEKNPTTIFKNKHALHAFHRAITLAEHFIRGEEPHPELFDFFVKFSEMVTGLEGQEKKSEALELFGVIHVLDMLGYWEGESLLSVFDETLAEKIIGQKKELVAMINQGIKASHID